MTASELQLHVRHRLTMAQRRWAQHDAHLVARPTIVQTYVEMCQPHSPYRPPRQSKRTIHTECDSKHSKLLSASWFLVGVQTERPLFQQKLTKQLHKRGQYGPVTSVTGTRDHDSFCTAGATEDFLCDHLTSSRPPPRTCTPHAGQPCTLQCQRGQPWRQLESPSQGTQERPLVSFMK